MVKFYFRTQYLSVQKNLFTNVYGDYFVLTEASFPWYSAGGRTEGTSSREACVIKFVGSRLPQVLHCAFTTIFSATQRCNIIVTLFRTITTLFQHCNAVLH